MPLYPAYPDVAWTPVTPVLTASTTNPTIGNSTVMMRYTKIGRVVFGYFHFIFGSTFTAGSGTYRVNLPLLAAAPGVANTSATVFSGWAYDASANDIRVIAGFINAVSNSWIEFFVPAVTNWSITHAVPWAWTNADQISGNFTYEAAA